MKKDNLNNFYKLPRFWTNTGFCPLGNINHKNISSYLLSKDVRMNLELIGSLPNKAITTIRIHWLLELLIFHGFEKNGGGKYDFRQMDKFLNWVDKAGLSVGFEFMGNPGNVFTEYRTNTSFEFLWEDLTFQITQRLLSRFGVGKIKEWKFESWNEPDLKTYNILNLNISDYEQYLSGLRKGLNAGARSTGLQDLHLPLRGPAGLFKNPDKHPLCWKILGKCNDDLRQCPFNVITYHRKGSGSAEDVITSTEELLDSIQAKYPNFKYLPFSNNEADPVAGWSVPRHFQSNVHYANTVTKIIFFHWHKMVTSDKFRNLESLSHDNAFLSYYPYTFDQRTLLARFQMNETKPKPYTQFIQKPIYALLGLLGNLAKYATHLNYVKKDDLYFIVTKNTLKSTTFPGVTYINSIIFSSDMDRRKNKSFSFRFQLPNTENTSLAFILEVIESENTDPEYVWTTFGRPKYPNATVREALRNAQIPKILHTAKLLRNLSNQSEVAIPIRTLNNPWILSLRICSSKVKPPPEVKNIRIRHIIEGEILILWHEVFTKERCLKSYEVYYSNSTVPPTGNSNQTEKWHKISENDHIPFPNYHYQSRNSIVSGWYKIRGIDIFNRPGKFSKIKKFSINKKIF